MSAGDYVDKHSDPTNGVGPAEEQIASIHLKVPGWQSLADFASNDGEYPIVDSQNQFNLSKIILENMTELFLRKKRKKPKGSITPI